MRPIILAAVACFVASPALAAPDDCYTLSYERNSIYKRAGYCFQTTAQIRLFGNSGCLYDEARDVPLSQMDRETIASIVREEHGRGCRMRPADW